MLSLHEDGISKTRRVVGYTLSILVSAMLLFAGLMKVAGAEEMLANMSKIPNIGELVTPIGIIELVCLALYWIPKTSNIGFFLLCSYAGGIIVAEIVGGELPAPGIMVSALLYIGTMLRKPSLFGLGI